MNKNGFTLLEITLVIVLSGLLAALVVPRYLDLRSEVRQEKVNQTALAITTAASLGYMENVVKGNAPVYPPASELKDRISLSGIELSWVDTGSCATADIDGQAYSFLYDQLTGFITVKNGKGSCKPAKKKK